MLSQACYHSVRSNKPSFARKTCFLHQSSDSHQGEQGYRAYGAVTDCEILCKMAVKCTNRKVTLCTIWPVTLPSARRFLRKKMLHRNLLSLSRRSHVINIVRKGSSSF